MDEWKEETLKMITVLMASYNGSRYIRQQLDSILAQDEEDVRILVSDDCSSDGSRELLKEYEASRGGPGAGAFTEGAVRRSSCPFPEAP